MAYKRKYRKGRVIRSVDVALAQNFVYIHGKILHHGWVASLQARYLNDMVRAGFVLEAIPTDGEEVQE